MAVTKDDVKYIAALAKLKFSDEELDKFTSQFNEILSYMGTLNELDTTNVEPLSHPLENENIFREDNHTPGCSSEEALKNAPSTDGTFFIVPKIITQPDKKP
ncbi:MAG: Asp-tRNA(Asn)/Glu-tRNA(Gln) amidotransferase subunit GatC [Ignavibacteriales bacterium]|nr:MAG: Asp-tRNA(Asn)/Glu-tRNA(Gln) amidotransferase subunit GatC [Ignavibacteriales bacterium]